MASDRSLLLFRRNDPPDGDTKSMPAIREKGIYLQEESASIGRWMVALDEPQYDDSGITDMRDLNDVCSRCSCDLLPSLGTHRISCAYSG
jgi:hypothetical protein